MVDRGSASSSGSPSRGRTSGSWRSSGWPAIGGLLLATIVTKGVVPLLYVVFVETLGVVKWKPDDEHGEEPFVAVAAEAEE